MKEKYAIIRENAKIYQKGSKKLKTQIWKELQEILGMNRHFSFFLFLAHPILTFQILKSNSCFNTYSLYSSSDFPLSFI